MTRLTLVLGGALAGLAPRAWASRPVFHGLSLEELVGRSAYVLVVRQAKPPSVRVRLPVGPAGRRAPPFELWGLRFQVAEVLRAPAGRPLRRGDVVTAYSVNWELEYEEHAGRVLRGTTLSYPAQRYAGVPPEGLEPSARYLLFLATAVRREGVPPGFAMVPGAVERLERRPEVERLLGGEVRSEPACARAREALERFLAGLPTACRADGDCDGYFYRASACLKAVVLAKPGVRPGSEAELLELQGRVRASCPSESVACAPNPFHAACRAGRCVDADLAPPPPRAGSLPSEWRGCRAAADCIVIAGACAGFWESVNARWRGEAEATLAKRRATVECARAEPGPLPKAACAQGVCAAR